SYLINLAALSNDMLEKSINLLIHEMDIADSLDADYVVLHTGSASRDNEENARNRAVEALKAVSQEKTWKAKLLLENTAGERGDISSRMKDLAEIIDKAGSRLIGGVCIDTCHAFAAGYDMSEKSGIQKLADEIKVFAGLDRVKLIHLNDSKRGCGSRVDRHEHIGQGGIGSEGLKRLVNHPAFEAVPLILETPKKEEGDDARNLKVVSSLIL
ncbi:MAG: deoxyribonuclease IV, partial [Nitrospirae bacterium]|nr:deoxyribonuclease IV [Nitrospirota bacterium]